ncbi:MAG: hypothetical protein ACOVMM_05835 [Chitinophagaceae bacterium]
MKKILYGLFIITAMIVVGCNDNDAASKDGIDKSDYQSKKESLLEKEKKSPTSFLEIIGEDKRNFWGKSVFKGVIKNNATQASYKNIRVKTLYFNAGQLIENHEDVFEDVLKPGNELDIKLKYKTPKGTDSVAASIMSAEVEN